MTKRVKIGTFFLPKNLQTEEKINNIVKLIHSSLYTEYKNKEIK